MQNLRALFEERCILTALDKEKSFDNKFYRSARIEFAYECFCNGYEAGYREGYRNALHNPRQKGQGEV